MNVSNASGPVLWEMDGRGVATLVLNRPEVNNAYDGDLIQGCWRQRMAFSGGRRPQEAQRNGLAAGSRIVGHLLENGPDAISQTKALAMGSASGNIDEQTFDRLVAAHAAKRQSAEAGEGLASFAQK